MIARGFMEKFKPEFDLSRKRGFSDNVIDKLFIRQSGSKYGVTNCQQLPLHFPFENNYYRTFVPNFTIRNVFKPNNFLRKFSPDGQLLLGISQDQRSLEVWDYQGIGQVADRIRNFKQECIFENQINPYGPVGVFDSILKKKWTIRLIQDNLSRCHLNREFSIFFDFDNESYVLMVAVSLSLNGHGADVYFRYPDICDDFDLFHYNFFLINLKTGTISDTKRFHNDYIVLTHNHGVSASNRTVAILSMHRQCVMLLELSNGVLTPTYEVGPFATALDALRVNSIPFKFDSANNEMVYSHFKQKILTYLYCDIVEIEDLDERRCKLSLFYKKFRVYERMYISKIQLIHPDFLLLRYEDKTPGVPVECNSRSEPDFKLYIFYSLESSEIIKIYEKDSVELLNLLRNYCDTFRNVQSFYTKRPSSSPSNDIFYKGVFDSVIDICSTPREAALRFNPTFPISTQSFSTSPYLDYGLFNYDDRHVSALERPKFVTPHPIVFTDRMTNRVKFRLYLDYDVVNNVWVPPGNAVVENPYNDIGIANVNVNANWASSGNNYGNTIAVGLSPSGVPLASSVSGAAGSSNAPSVSGQLAGANSSTNPISSSNAAVSTSSSTAASSGVIVQGSTASSAALPLINNRDIVFFIFHPFEPFIISMQKFGMRHIINFHLYNPSTIVAQ